MADDVETEETESEVEISEPELPKKRPYLMLHSGVRKRHTRHLRMQNAMAYRAKFVQKVGGGAIIVRRNRPAPIYEEQFHMFRKELEEKIALGILELRTPDGRLIDIASMRAAPAPVPPPLPNLVRTEVMPGTRHIPLMPGGTGEGEKPASPEVLKDKLPDSPTNDTKVPTLLQKDAVPPPPASEATDPEVPPAPTSEATTDAPPPPVEGAQENPEPQEKPLSDAEDAPPPPTEPAPPKPPPPPVDEPPPPQQTEPMAPKHEDRSSSKRDRKDKRR